MLCVFHSSFGQLILRKVVDIVATRRQISWMKCTKLDFGWDFDPYPDGELTALPHWISGVLLLRGKRGKEVEERRGGSERGGKRKGRGGGKKGKGMEKEALRHNFSPLLQFRFSRNMSERVSRISSTVDTAVMYISKSNDQTV